jgi:hypothetical protein
VEGRIADEKTSHTLQPKEDAMRSRTVKKLDTYAFVGTVLAIVSVLLWVITTVH